MITCMDARIDPARAFGIGLGDAPVVRNVSGPLLPLSLLIVEAVPMGA